MFSRSINPITRAVFRNRLTHPNLRSIARPQFFQRTLAPSSNPRQLFSTGSVNRSAGQVDRDLTNKLEAEITYEKEAGSTDEPDWLTAFRSDGTFTIEDQPGSDEVILTRKFGNEQIRITFSCSDYENEMEDEEDLEIENQEEETVDKPSTNCRIRTCISIIKSGKGGMVIDSTTDGTGFEIENVAFYDDENLALDGSSELDWKRRGLYFGPKFMDLDEELQSTFNEFLEERSIGVDLASILIDLAEFKEQKEYVSWLNKLSKFVKS